MKHYVWQYLHACGWIHGKRATIVINPNGKPWIENGSPISGKIGMSDSCAYRVWPFADSNQHADQQANRQQKMYPNKWRCLRVIPKNHGFQHKNGEILDDLEVPPC